MLQHCKFFNYLVSSPWSNMPMTKMQAYHYVRDMGTAVKLTY